VQIGLSSELVGKLSLMGPSLEQTARLAVVAPEFGASEIAYTALLE
jgi:hypothetical protein